MKHTVYDEVCGGIAVTRTECDGCSAMPVSHVHSEYEIYYLLTGERCYVIENRLYPVKAGSLVFISRNELHRTSDASEVTGHDRILILLKEEWLDPFLHSLGLFSLGDFFGRIKVYSPPEPDTTPIRELVFNIADEMSCRRTGYEAAVKCRLTELLLYVYRYCEKNEQWSPAPSSAGNRKIQDITEYIRKNFRMNLTLKTIADHFYLNKEYVSRIFRVGTGFTVNEYIHIQRIRFAAELLLSDDESVTRISERCGYDSITYFERMFKRYIGIPPLKYRKLHSENE